MWLGTDNGVFTLDTAFNIVHHFSTKDGLLNNFIISIAEDNDQNIWLASLQNGITKISPKNTAFIFKSFCVNKKYTI